MGKLETYEDIVKATIEEREIAIIENLTKAHLLEQATDSLQFKAIHCVRGGKVTEEAKVKCAKVDGMTDMRNYCIQVVRSFMQEKSEQ